jgi:prepilin-type N-terminal cleavage/methylation domain-containing protein
MKQACHKRGFTLLEIMVSITILALMALMISRIFSETTRAVGRGKNQALLDATARQLLDVLEQDISQAVIRTNLAFRVHAIDNTDALYFVSTAVRRNNETLPRDTGPVQLRILSRNEQAPDLHLSVLSKQADASSIINAKELSNLLRLSDCYYTLPVQTAGDFEPIHGTRTMEQREIEYTTPAEENRETENHAVISFMDITINHNPESNRNSDLPVDIRDVPRFADVAIGLVASTDMEKAIQLHTAQGQDKAWDYLEQHEHIYTRRIYMRNTGIAPLNL